MNKDKFGQLVLDESDLVDCLMSKKDVDFNNVLVRDNTILDKISELIDIPKLKKWEDLDISVEEFDSKHQAVWRMPQEYQNFDIAAYVLSLCQSDAELQRCGQELLMFHERNLFDLLRYLHYLVQIMKSNNIIWGVGRGSSTASYVLYKLEVHKIDSLYYDLDPSEFLR